MNYSITVIEGNRTLTISAPTAEEVIILLEAYDRYRQLEAKQ